MGVCHNVFKAMTATSEAKKYISYLFKQVYERIDFDFMDGRNIYKLYQSHAVKAANQRTPEAIRRQSSQNIADSATIDEEF